MAQCGYVLLRPAQTIVELVDVIRLAQLCPRFYRFEPRDPETSWAKLRSGRSSLTRQAKRASKGSNCTMCGSGIQASTLATQNGAGSFAPRAAIIGQTSRSPDTESIR